MKLNNLKKAPRKKGATVPEAEPSSLAEVFAQQSQVEAILEARRTEQIEILKQAFNGFRVELVDNYDDKKDTVSLKVKETTKNFIGILKNKGGVIITFKDLENYVVELNLFDNKNSLHGNLFLERISSDAEIIFYMKIDRNQRDSDNDIKIELKRQIENQKNNAYATVQILLTTYPANDGIIKLEKIAPDISKEPRAALRKKSASLQDSGLPDAAITEIEKAGYHLRIEGKTDELAIVHAGFAGVLIKTDINTQGELLVKISEQDLLGNVSNRVSDGFGKLIENVSYRAKITKKKPARVLDRKIAAKNTMIDESGLEYLNFNKLATKLLQIYNGNETAETAETAIERRPVISGLIELSGQGSKLVSGRIKDLFYDNKNKDIKFTMTDAEFPVGGQTGGWYDLRYASGVFEGRADFTIATSKWMAYPS